MHQIRPVHVHPLETLGPGVAEAADEEPGGVAGDDGHGVWSGGETSLMEPLAAPHTPHHLLVPAARTSAVAVNVLEREVRGYQTQTLRSHLLVLTVGLVPAQRLLVVGEVQLVNKIQFFDGDIVRVLVERVQIADGSVDGA